MTSSRSRFLETAIRIGARICRDAIWSGDRCSWLGDSTEKLDGSWKVAHRVLGPDLYGGTAGVALVLDRLHAFTGEPVFRETAEGAIRQACSRIPQLATVVGPSFYLGITGIAYTLTAMGLEERAHDALRFLTEADHSPEEPDENSLDVIGGVAGAIPALLSMAAMLSDRELVALALRYGEGLLRLARKGATGWSWNTLRVPPERRREDLTGFAHGAAGIAWALSELFRYTKDVRFRSAAEEARRYESSHFSPQHSNWPDFRYLYDRDSQHLDGPTYPISWCHGAPGIGFDRVRAYQIFGGQALEQEVKIALRTTETILTYFKGANFSLCHGLGGNADLFIYAAEALNDPVKMALAEQVGEQGIDQIERQDLRWPCGVTDGDETPSLMLGTAGIAYFYLRLYDPCQVPSVLILRAQEQNETAA